MSFDEIDEQLDRMGIETEEPVVYVCFIEDHSGSMGMGSPIRGSLAMENYNEQLAKIKREAAEVDTYISKIQFDDRIWVKENHVPAQDAELMDSWWTEGLTALYDAIGKGIDIVEKQMDRDERENKSALIIVLTDGAENKSQKYERMDIKNKITDLELTEKWTFVFMGGNIDEDVAIEGMSFAAGNTVSFDACTNSVEDFKKMSGATVQGLDKYYTMRKAGGTQTKEFMADFKEEDDKWQQNS